MNIFFTSKINKSISRDYKWVPLSYIAYVTVLTLITLFNIPHFQDDNLKLSFIIFLTVVFSGSIIMFCVQALARIESKLIDLMEQTNKSNLDS